MEQSERLRLETIKRQLHKGLTSIEELLQHAKPPQRLSKEAIRKRAQSICERVRKQGGTVSRDELRKIAAKHGIQFTAIGALVGSGYLRTVKNGFAIGKRGTTFRAKTGHRRRRR